jgi:hypothetical protein
VKKQRRERKRERENRRTGEQDALRKENFLKVRRKIDMFKAGYSRLFGGHWISRL